MTAARTDAAAALTATLGLAAGCWAVSAWQMTGMGMGVATRLGSFGFFIAVWVAMMQFRRRCLGWSPVFRGLARLKRRSDPLVDHVEDGGRAAVADEAIAWAVFCHARRRD